MPGGKQKNPASRRSRLSPRQRRFFEFLSEKERAGARFSAADIASATGWKPDSVRAYLSEGHWTRVVAREGNKTFRAVDVGSLSEREFHARISQSKNVQSFAHGLRNQLAASLLARSRDNMVLALELYNRPSLENRLDGFVMLYCAAWEQMLKAQLIERDGEQSIFKKHKPGQERRTIGLTDAIAQIFTSKSPARSNLEDIQFVRDQAVHLLVPELQPVMARLFQAGVFNYARHFKQIADEPFVPHSAIGLLTLVSDMDTPSVVNLRAAYGTTTGDEIEGMRKRISDAIEREQSWEYAVPLRYRLVFSEKDGDGDINLTKAAEDALDAKTFVVVEKTKDRTHTHPHLPTVAVRAVRDQLRAEMTPTQLAQHLVSRKDGSPDFTLHDFQSIVFREGWRSSNNEFHYCDEEIHRRWYSQKAVEVAVSRIRTSSTYVGQAREAYKKKTTTTRKSKS